MNAMNDGANVENLQCTLKSLRHLRHSFINYLSSLTDNSTNNTEEELDLATQKPFLELRTNLKELEKNIVNLVPMSLNPPGVPAILSNIDVLSLDPSPDKLPLYHQLLDCYMWSDKVVSYSSMVHSICNRNPLKRSIMPQPNPMKRKRALPTIFNATISPQNVDATISNIKAMFPEMTINLIRPNGSNAILQVILGKVLKAVISFRGLLIESVVIRGYNEPHTDEDGKVDLYESSQFKVFQMVSDNANAAMLHFFTPGYAELSIRSFFTWLNSYLTLFTDLCKKCQHHVRCNFPPTWRDFKSLQAFHEECRP